MMNIYSIIIYRLGDPPRFVDSFETDELPFDLSFKGRTVRRIIEKPLRPGQYFIVGVISNEVRPGKPSSWSWLLKIPEVAPPPKPVWSTTGCEPVDL